MRWGRTIPDDDDDDDDVLSYVTNVWFKRIGARKITTCCASVRVFYKALTTVLIPKFFKSANRIYNKRKRKELDNYMWAQYIFEVWRPNGDCGGRKMWNIGLMLTPRTSRVVCSRASVIWTSSASLSRPIEVITLHLNPVAQTPFEAAPFFVCRAYRSRLITAIATVILVVTYLNDEVEEINTTRDTLADSS